MIFYKGINITRSLPIFQVLECKLEATKNRNKKFIFLSYILNNPLLIMAATVDLPRVTAAWWKRRGGYREF